jgi:hypothetical protein
VNEQLEASIIINRITMKRQIIYISMAVALLIGANAAPKGISNKLA